MKSTSTQDGAFAWLLCLLSFLNHVIIGGYIYSTGIFYIMFKNSLDATDSEVALITSINSGVMFSICPFVGLLCDRFGSRCVAVASAAISSIGLASSAFSTQIVHLYISFGIIAGAGQGVVNVIGISILNPYFQKYKRTACSIALAGYGFGSFIVPPILKFSEDFYGWRGAILLMAGINVHLMVTCSMFRPFKDVLQLKRSVPLKACEIMEDKKQPSITVTFLSKPAPYVKPKQVDTIKSKGLEMFSLLRVIPFICVCLCNLLNTFAHSIISTHFGSYLITLQYTSEDVVKLYMTLGICATVTRPLTGTLAEVTHANSGMLIMFSSILNGVLTILIPFMKDLCMMYAYAVVFQFLSGPYLALPASITMEHIPKSQVATAYGIYYLFCVPGYLLAAPIGAWLYDYTGMYAHPFYLAGGLITLAGLIMAPAALYIHKNRHC